MADAAENESKADEMLLKRCAYHGLNFSAPFIVMRHWDELHQDGQFWCGEFTTDETDWKLAMAEAYFDNKLRDATANVQRQQKTIEGFNRLPEVFTTDDVMRCFGLSQLIVANTKITRLMKDHLVEKGESFTENGHRRWKYHKTGSMV